MPKVVSLFLPTWPTDRLRRKLGAAAPSAETALVLIGREGRRRVVLAADRAALAAGLRIGMPATKAQALVPGLIIRDADPVADADALDRLAVWALQRYAPIVAADPPDGLVVEATGAAHLHGGESNMLADIVGRLAASGIAARAAMADSWGAAHALARTIAWTFALGDKVMQIENDYDKEVYNGDIGYIDDIDLDEGQLVASFDGRSVAYRFGELDMLAPAYAATIHKSQGSEYPAVIIPMLTQHYTMLQRNLLYTGVTRGKRLVVLVGQKKAVAIAVHNISGRRRWSKLGEWRRAGASPMRQLGAAD